MRLASWSPLVSAPLGAVLLCGALGCTGRRVLVLENKLLQMENAELQRQLSEMEREAPDRRDYVRDPDISHFEAFLDRAGYAYTLHSEPSPAHIEVPWRGKNTSFTLNLQHFPSADVLYVATADYIALEDAQNTQSVVLLMVHLAALNYEMLIGKFQLNPESGEVHLSSEILLRDGVGYETFVGAIEHLVRTADSRFPEIQRTASGVGL